MQLLGRREVVGLREAVGDRALKPFERIAEIRLGLCISSASTVDGKRTRHGYAAGKRGKVGGGVGKAATVSKRVREFQAGREMRGGYSWSPVWKVPIEFVFAIPPPSSPLFSTPLHSSPLPPPPSILHLMPPRAACSVHDRATIMSGPGPGAGHCP
jgi:hypothetical protein